MKIINMKIVRKVSLVVLAVAFMFGLAGLIIAATTVNLGTADSFAILAGTAITNTGPSVISGDVGLSPEVGTKITGLLTTEVSGTIYAVDANGPAGAAGNNPGLVNAAKADLITAYNNAAGQLPNSTVASELGGTTKNAGIYNSADGQFGITGTLTLDAQGNPNAVFIFKTATTLITAGASNVVLINGAQACNVFWQVGSSATLGVNSFFKGNILALTAVTLTTGANVEGRVLARNAAVTLDHNIVTKATCVLLAVYPVAAPQFPPLINVIKIPNPLALPSGPGLVTYTYTATNIGEIAMSNAWVRDDKCSPVEFISGDIDNDSMLDIHESWVYRCTKTVSSTETNTATAHGASAIGDMWDTANATVVVGVPLTPPLIHLVKIPSRFVLPAGGGAVTYTYTVTNPGTEPLNNVSVIDDKCTGLPGRVLGHPGDINKNNLLESNEVWSFACQTNLTKTTTNTGMAEGHANGLTAIDFSPATVVVIPALPNTGLHSERENTLWGIVILAGILMLISTSLVVFLKKRTI